MKSIYIFSIVISSLLLSLPSAFAHNMHCYNQYQYQNQHHYKTASNMRYMANNETHLNNMNSRKGDSPYLDNNSSSNIVNISDLKNIKDDEYITLKGYIIKKIKNEKFLFKDSTGEIILEIDKKINKQLTNVNKNTLVEVYGELDKEILGKTEIDVKKITIVNR